jgi:cell division protein FtsA
MNEVTVGLDIGTSKVCTILGQLNKSNQLQILGVGTAQCKGIKKGVVVDIDSVAQTIKESVIQAERMSDMEVKSVFINIPGGHVTLIKNRGIIAVSGDEREITREDVERVLQEVRIGAIPVDREIIGVIPLQFIVDEYQNIKDPVGMAGVRLEVEAYIITAAASAVQNLIRCVERCNIDVAGIVIDPLASGQVILTRDEKELGVALIDIGGETTDISIFIDSTLVYTKLIPVGGMHITNDISIGLKIPAVDAEQLKRQYGYASVSLVPTDGDIPVSSQGISQKKMVNNKELVDIIEARVQEIFCLVQRELEASGFLGRIPGGVVITGGGTSFLKGVLEISSSIIGLPVRIGIPQFIGVASPVYSAATGIVKYILSCQKYDPSLLHEERMIGTRLKKKTSEKDEKVINRIKNFLTDFF